MLVTCITAIIAPEASCVTTFTWSWQAAPITSSLGQVAGRSSLRQVEVTVAMQVNAVDGGGHRTLVAEDLAQSVSPILGQARLCRLLAQQETEPSLAKHRMNRLVEILGNGRVTSTAIHDIYMVRDYDLDLLRADSTSDLVKERSDRRGLPWPRKRREA